MSFTIKIDVEALKDIQEAVSWYDSQQSGLGEDFFEHIESAVSNLQANPYYQIRYLNVRCLPIRKFPYMIHYTLDELSQEVIIRAVFNTALNPARWPQRGKPLK